MEGKIFCFGRCTEIAAIDGVSIEIKPNNIEKAEIAAIVGKIDAWVEYKAQIKAIFSSLERHVEINSIQA